MRRRVIADDAALDRAVGLRIRAARKERGLTQRQAAGERFTGAYISAMERGLTHPSLSALAYLAPRLGVSMRDLLPDNDELEEGAA